MKALLLLALVSGCSLTNLNRATLASATAALACDWGQTRSAAKEDWICCIESNPILRDAPSVSRLDNYFFAVYATNFLLYALLPKKVKWVLPSLITSAQIYTIRGNARTVPKPVCGL